MRYATLCSGIEAPSVAWDSLGWEPAFFSEIEPFPSHVLAHHYPNTPNVGDMNLFYERTKNDAGYVGSLGRIDLLCAGTPCQSFSLAGLRKGLDDPRGNLALVYLGIVERIKPTWVIWENVPGVLSSWSTAGKADENGEWEETNDFTTFLAALGELGYGYAWRVLDAQHFGVPQRRRRVFVVGYLGDWRRAAAVLFERESMSGNIAPGKQKGKAVAEFAANGVGTCGPNDRVASTLDASFARLQGTSSQDCNHGHSHLVFGGNNTNGSIEVAQALNAKGGSGRSDFESEAIIFDARQSVSQSSVPGPIAGALNTNAEGLAVMVDFRNNTVDEVSQTLQSQNKSYSLNSMPSVLCLQSGDEIAPTLTAPNTTKSVVDGKRQDGSRQDKHPIVLQELTLRRITPIEAERLQGFPDNYTLIPFKKKNAADGPRYKAIGNSMAVPVMKWIGERIQFVQDLINNNEI